MFVAVAGLMVAPARVQAIEQDASATRSTHLVCVPKAFDGVLDAQIVTVWSATQSCAVGVLKHRARVAWPHSARWTDHDRSMKISGVRVG
jgi:hypothetical protein